MGQTRLSLVSHTIMNKHKKAPNEETVEDILDSFTQYFRTFGRAAQKNIDVLCVLFGVRLN